MQRVLRILASALLVWGLSLRCAAADDSSLLPMYGAAPKNEAQQAADDRFLAASDQQYKGDRKKAAQDVAMRGWQSLRRGNPRDAMRRFNQSWLLDSSNGSALWGMGAVQGSAGKTGEALKLFQKAEQSLANDIDFSVDYARALGMAGAETKDAVLLQQAFGRFARIHEMAPQNTLNLQNWAITLFDIGNYAEAWKKIQLAEATPRRSELDSSFIAALQEKMPRP